VNAAIRRICASNETRAQLRLHLIECLKPMFTVLKKCKLQAILRDRINWVEIVAPYGRGMVTVLRTPTRPNYKFDQPVYTGAIIYEESRFAFREG
jgi:hypothetical protein